MSIAPITGRDGIANDFNNLLIVIGGYAEILVDDLAAGTSPREGAEEIRNAAAKAANLTAQLLAFSRKQVFEPVSWILARWSRKWSGCSAA